MQIDDPKRTRHYLQHINYYRLTAYWLPFEADHDTHQFYPGTRFEAVLNLYIFDREFRLLLLDAIERVEVSVRTQWAYYMAHRYGPHSYLNAAHATNPRWHAYCLMTNQLPHVQSTSCMLTAMSPRRLRTEEKIEALRECVEHGSEAQALDCLRKAFAESSNFLVAKAAQFAGERLVYGLITELRTAFERFAGDDAAQADKTSAAKKAIARALYELDLDDAAFYRRFLHYRQLEAAFGESVDTAVDVRCTCALGLAASGDPSAVLDLVELLYDAEWQARLGAVKAVELLHPFHAEIVLRQKILQGDDEPEVIAQCFSSLLKAAEEHALPFVLQWLTRGDPVRQESAALALGESRLEGALEPLIEATERLMPLDPRTKVFFQAIALQRREPAYQYLLGKIANLPVSSAVYAAEALSIYSYNRELRDQIMAIARERKSKSLDDAIAAHWKE